MRLLSRQKLLLGAGVMVLLAGVLGATAAADPGQSGNDHPGALSLHQVATVSYPAPYKTPTSFDISWVDPSSQTYYLADHTNDGVDAINASTDTFESVIGQGDFVGNGSGPSSCGPHGVGGPDGILTLQVGGQTQLWAGNGVSAASPVSTVKVFSLTGPSTGTLAATIQTDGICRADEMAYDATDHLLIVANDVDTPPFLSLISVNADPTKDAVVAKIPVADAIDGIEQSVWDPANDLFYVNIPQVPTSNGDWLGEVLTVNPKSMSVGQSFPAPACSAGGLALDANTQQLLLGCSGDAIKGDTVGTVTYHPNPAVTLVMDARNGHLEASFPQVGGSDEVWLDTQSGTFYLAASSMTSNGLSTGYPTPSLGVISTGNGRFGRGNGPQFVENVPTTAGAHSVAANSANGQVFVPINGYGIAVFSAGQGHGQGQSGGS